MAGRDHHLGGRRQLQNLLQRREALRRAVRVGRQAEVEGDHAGLVGTQQLDGLLAVAGHEHLIVLEAPLQLPLQARVVLDDQKFWSVPTHGRSTAAPSKLCTILRVDSGSRTVKVVP